MRLTKIEAKHCDDLTNTWSFNPIETYINIDLIVGIRKLPNKYGKKLGSFYLLKLSGYHDLEITVETLNTILSLIKACDRDDKINEILE